MIRQSRVIYAITLAWDPDNMTEAEAQHVALEGFPDVFRLGNGVSVSQVRALLVERIAGGVDDDGVANQPRADQVQLPAPQPRAEQRKQS